MIIIIITPGNLHKCVGDGCLCSLLWQAVFIMDGACSHLCSDAGATEWDCCFHRWGRQPRPHTSPTPPPHLPHLASAKASNNCCSSAVWRLGYGPPFVLWWSPESWDYALGVFREGGAIGYSGGSLWFQPEFVPGGLWTENKDSGSQCMVSPHAYLAGETILWQGRQFFSG